MPPTDIAPGLWIWRLQHPDWSAEQTGSRMSTSTCVETGGEVALIDPLAPPEDARGLGAARRRAADARRRPQAGPRPRRRPLRAPLRRARVRAEPLLAARHPRDRARGDRARRELPGGLVALYDGRGRNETPLWLPEQRALVFADALTERDGELRVWATPWHEERVLPALRALLDLPFEHVIVSHGEPVHDRAAFERALELPAFGPYGRRAGCPALRVSDACRGYGVCVIALSAFTMPVPTQSSKPNAVTAA